ncbi:MAG: hypothetical protein ACMXYG_06820 [Candidatus Woesearchaeota archaeon]
MVATKYRKQINKYVEKQTQLDDSTKDLIRDILTYDYVRSAKYDGKRKNKFDYNGINVHTYEGRIKAAQQLGAQINDISDLFLIKSAIKSNDYLRRDRKKNKSSESRTDQIFDYLHVLHSQTDSKASGYSDDASLSNSSVLADSNSEKLEAIVHSDKSRETISSVNSDSEALSLADGYSSLDSSNMQSSLSNKSIRRKKGFTSSTLGYIAKAAAIAGIFLGGLGFATRYSAGSSTSEVDESAVTSNVEVMSAPYSDSFPKPEDIVEVIFPDANTKKVQTVLPQSLDVLDSSQEIIPLEKSDINDVQEVLPIYENKKLVSDADTSLPQYSSSVPSPEEIVDVIVPIITDVKEQQSNISPSSNLSNLVQDAVVLDNSVSIDIPDSVSSYKNPRLVDEPDASLPKYSSVPSPEEIVDVIVPIRTQPEAVVDSRYIDNDDLSLDVPSTSNSRSQRTIDDVASIQSSPASDSSVSIYTPVTRSVSATHALSQLLSDSNFFDQVNSDIGMIYQGIIPSNYSSDEPDFSVNFRSRELGKTRNILKYLNVVNPFYYLDSYSEIPFEAEAEKYNLDHPALPQPVFRSGTWFKVDANPSRGNHILTLLRNGSEDGELLLYERRGPNDAIPTDSFFLYNQIDFTGKRVRIDLDTNSLTLDDREFYFRSNDPTKFQFVVIEYDSAGNIIKQGVRRINVMPRNHDGLYATAGFAAGFACPVSAIPLNVASLSTEIANRGTDSRFKTPEPLQDLERRIVVASENANPLSSDAALGLAYIAQYRQGLFDRGEIEIYGMDIAELSDIVFPVRARNTESRNVTSTNGINVEQYLIRETGELVGTRKKSGGTLVDFSSGHTVDHANVNNKRVRYSFRQYDTERAPRSGIFDFRRRFRSSGNLDHNRLKELTVLRNSSGRVVDYFITGYRDVSDPYRVITPIADGSTLGALARFGYDELTKDSSKPEPQQEVETQPDSRPRPETRPDPRPEPSPEVPPSEPSRPPLIEGGPPAKPPIVDGGSPSGTHVIDGGPSRPPLLQNGGGVNPSGSAINPTVNASAGDLSGSPLFQ